MNNSGSDSPVDVNESAPRRVPVRIIIMGLVAVVFAVVVGSQVIGILYAIFFPPATPVPDQVTLVTHDSKDYGVDDWLYTSNQNACEVVQFYQSKDGDCRIAPLRCTSADAIGAAPSVSKTTPQNIARCVGVQNFSIFALRWQVVIASGGNSDSLTQFRLSREIYWTGAVPPISPPTLDGGFPDFPTDSQPPTTTS